mmetsp:Transcript_34269/g.46648  ORF Transcript_34269/g.46648 Transcript_34269/m.46648 type:complete len:85 (-) Transcript_34269:77-331(-)
MSLKWLKKMLLLDSLDLLLLYMITLELINHQYDSVWCSASAMAGAQRGSAAVFLHCLRPVLPVVLCRLGSIRLPRGIDVLLEVF